MPAALDRNVVLGIATTVLHLDEIILPADIELSVKVFSMHFWKKKLMRGLHYALIVLATKLGTATAAFVNYQPFCNLKTQLFGAPEEALQDIVIPNIFSSPADFNDEDTRLWVPQTDCLSFRPLCLCVSQGYYVNLLKFKGGGMLSRHRHSSPVHALTIKGHWRYAEHSWRASPGTYVFEPPGETHTLLVEKEEMVAMFHVAGSLLYLDKDDNIVGFDDVFTKLEKAKEWYTACGLGADFVMQFVR